MSKARLAATAIATLIATLIATMAGLLAGCTPGGDPANAPGSTSGTAVRTLSGSRLPPDALPPYFIALAPTGSPVSWYPLNLTVRATLSGKALATVRPPKSPGTFGFVGASTSDDRTFLVGAQRWRTVGHTVLTDFEAVSFYLLRFDPVGDRTSLVPLPVPVEMPGHLVSAALSPDGTRLAVAVVATGGRTLTLHVYSLPAGGSGRTWTVTGAQAESFWGSRLSWSANDRVVALGEPHGTVRLLDTTAPGSDLAAAGETITLGVGMGNALAGLHCYLSAAIMTSDGRKLICGASKDYADGEGLALGPGTGAFAVYSPVSGSMVAVADPQGPGHPTNAAQEPEIAWASPRGTILIGFSLFGAPLVITGGHAQPLAWPAGIVSSAIPAPAIAW